MALGSGKLRAATNRVRCARGDRDRRPRLQDGCPLRLVIVRTFGLSRLKYPSDARVPRVPRLPRPRPSPPWRGPHPRTSLANNTNEIWTDLIGIQQSKDAGTNSAIEASIKVPGRIGGAGVGTGRRRQRDDAIIHPTEALVALARLQSARNSAAGAVVEGDRGVCRVCGGTGHLTSMCKNEYAMLKDDDDAAEDSVTDLSSDSDSDSGDGGGRKRKRKSGGKKKKRKKSHRKKKSSGKGRKKSSKRKKKKRRRDSSSDSDSDSDSDSSSSSSSSSS
ncbi:uncharacterized protein MICPUCDRAFT_59568 [Micromonas pusilla CCMP1545]|jgi:hypothetical protein|uniref:Predicted protein n=1 Tax=Micromonas pusilla (strain CCMP1545) TaxID=564608 RepID=C1MVZ6_MICPC|nr:uncharacterized protein MICPUCDRAFT_59568 [Micromonas pusilla CCMP1545]EEH55790.1 predicted protein [Micromonas pusilla CCMP1545]|tara:strand:+ start:306 stop:1133 length:828 start_codon:yes stop_codon:yes gene_type:complete|eukprot:XP_003059838.1 predicted protein [Micromonas pusilla CCMP1545]